jgi:hypothetical protein
MTRTLRGVAVAGVLAVSACGADGGPGVPSGVGPNPAVVYLEAVLDTMQANSVNRLKIDWVSFRSQTYAAIPGAQTIQETYPAIRVALGLLNDRHSFFRQPGGSNILNPNAPTDCGVASSPVTGVPADIGYVYVGAFGGPGGAEFAAQIQQRIREQDSDQIAGWIVDVRRNGGGNMWPMIAGVGPILGAGTAGFFVPPFGSATRWGYGAQGSFSGSALAQPVSDAYALRRPNPRVAVLTDKGVASSGEAVVVAFRARPDTRSFGTETCGVPTSNFGFAMSDGATLLLTTALDADRTGQTYDAPIAPDEVITDPGGVVQRAIEWIRASGFVQ